MKSTIQSFYNAFNKLDADTMTALYHDEVFFQDPAFGVLRGKRAKNMWRMLCETQKNKDFKVIAYNFEVLDNRGKARWEAFYTFGKTGRPIHNVIDAKFEFKEGKIIRHIDQFDLYRWSKQALGMKGLVIGWTPYFRSELNKQTNRLLDKFEQTQDSHEQRR